MLICDPLVFTLMDLEGTDSLRLQYADFCDLVYTRDEQHSIYQSCENKRIETKLVWKDGIGQTDCYVQLHIQVKGWNSFGSL